MYLSAVRRCYVEHVASCVRIGVALTTLVAAFPSAAAAQLISPLTERLVDVDGRQVQVWVGGPANSEGPVPLVIFENGWSGIASSWAKVAPEVARFARVLLYNRASHGRSESDAQLPTPEHVARRLRALLKALDIAPPYVLVGHSWGGPLIRAHAALYPEAVAGLVYVDPGLPCVLERAFEAAGFGDRASEFIERTQRPDAAGVRARQVQSGQDTIRLALPDVPLVLLIGLKLDMQPPPREWLRERGINADTIVARAREQKVPCLSWLASEVPRGLLVVTPTSGHVIQQDDPELVVWAIRRTLSQAERSAGSAAPAQENSRSRQDTLYALTNATVIDGTGTAPRSSITLLIEHGRIREIFPTRERSVPPFVQTVDLAGQFLIPGLINTHVHFAALRPASREGAVAALERMFYAGVTTVREMVGDTRRSGELARAALMGERPMPRIHYAALMAGSTFFEDARVPATSIGYEGGAAPWAQAVTPDTDIPRAIGRAAGTGAAGIKIYADLDTGLVRRLADEARRQGLQTWAHSTLFPTRPMEVISAGVDGLSHVCGLVWQSLPEVPKQYRERGTFDPAGVNLSGAAFQMLLREMSRHGTVFDATASHFFRNARAREAGCIPELLTDILRALNAAGVPISTGTDYWIAEGEPDPTLFTEIEYLVKIGVLSPLEAITAATLNGARAIGVEDTHGSIEVGKVADLVVLAADPTRDIAALRNVVTVIKDGVAYQRRDYRRR
jgi:imidazolonepropionase-like amidohydrolase/pimeloyl-ACP methyl ester carboxylesterase